MDIGFALVATTENFTNCSIKDTVVPAVCTPSVSSQGDGSTRED